MKRPAFMLAHRVERAPRQPWGNEGWVMETKANGWRVLYVQGTDGGHLLTRGGIDWTSRQPTFANLGLPPGSALDGELLAAGSRSAIIILFDVLSVGTIDLRREPWMTRREALVLVVETLARPDVTASEVLGIPDRAMADALIASGAEGVVCKRVASRYVGRRSTDWLKYKAASGSPLRSLEWLAARGYSPRRVA